MKYLVQLQHESEDKTKSWTGEADGEEHAAEQAQEADENYYAYDVEGV